MTQFKVGDEVVVFIGKHPVSHNSFNNQHPCRGRVLKVGRKLYHIESIGAPLKIEINAAEDDWRVLSVSDGKTLHRQNFQGPNEWRTPEFINEIIDSL